MQHRSPRPLLDRLLPDAAPGMARRALLLVGAVVGAVALGVAVAGPLADPAPAERTVAVKSPLDSASWSIGTPPQDRESRPSRGKERSAPPAPPVEPEPTPTATAPERTPSSDQRPSRSPSRTASPSPAQTNQGSPSPSPRDTDAPNTSAATTSVEDGAWTVSSTADESGSFECSLDGAEYVACGPNATFDDLDNGKHTLAVRAVDEAGNVDPSPAELVTNITGNLDD